jgi:hypothetical protein
MLFFRSAINIRTIKAVYTLPFHRPCNLCLLYGSIIGLTIVGCWLCEGEWKGESRLIANWLSFLCLQSIKSNKFGNLLPYDFGVKDVIYVRAEISTNPFSIYPITLLRETFAINLRLKGKSKNKRRTLKNRDQYVPMPRYSTCRLAK